MSALTRPVLRYHGGKWKLAPWIIGYFPPHRVYVEPFGGAASVLLRKQRSYAEVYNDLDGEIVNLFRVLRNPAQARELVRLVKLTPFAREEFEESYITHGDPIEQARRTLARSFMGFGSNAHNRATGFRANSTRSGTTPAHDWMHLPAAIDAIIERLRGVIIENRDAAECMRQHDSPKTLHYVDPPYVTSTRDSGSDYRYEMADAHHRDLADCLRSLSGMVIVSGYACDLYNVELYPDWRRVERESYADGARERVEVLWMNRAAESAGLPLFQEIA